MNELITFGYLLVILLGWVWGSYQFNRGVKIGFSRGLKSANTFMRLKRTAENQFNGRN